MNFRRILRWLAVFALGLVGILVVVLNFTATETLLKCEGEIVEGEEAQPVSLYVSLKKYRWWVKLWSDSEGSMQVETTEGLLLYFPTLENLGPVWHVYEDSPQQGLRGSYSTLSRSFKLATPSGFFEGSCTAEY